MGLTNLGCLQRLRGQDIRSTALGQYSPNFKGIVSKDFQSPAHFLLNEASVKAYPQHGCTNSNFGCTVYTLARAQSYSVQREFFLAPLKGEKKLSRMVLILPVELKQSPCLRIVNDYFSTCPRSQ